MGCSRARPRLTTPSVTRRRHPHPRAATLSASLCAGTLGVRDDQVSSRRCAGIPDRRTRRGAGRHGRARLGRDRSALRAGRFAAARARTECRLRRQRRCAARCCFALLSPGSPSALVIGPPRSAFARPSPCPARRPEASGWSPRRRPLRHPPARSTRSPRRGTARERDIDGMDRVEFGSISSLCSPPHGAAQPWCLP
jgi:hypothetical protein